MTTEPEILADRRGDVLTITLNRPDTLNALTLDMVGAIDGLLDAAEADDTRVVVFTGAGRAFCAGADLKAIGTEPGASLPFLERLQALYVRIMGFPAPVIAQVNGTAMGGGTELILACDFAIAADTAKVGDGHLNVGVVPGAGGASILPRRVPAAIAKYVVYTGTRLTAQQWAHYGLFAEVTAPEELDQRVREIADDLAAKSPLALRTAKDVIAKALVIDDPALAMATELEANRGYASSHDMAEGIAAFAEKRPPRFLGR